MIRGSVDQTELAVADLRDAASWIAADSPEAAERFLLAAERTFQQLSETPYIGRRRQLVGVRIANLRMWKIRGFSNYLVFYLPINDGVRIIRVIHGARDPESSFGRSTMP